MIISVTRSGGFAGLSDEIARVDTAKLDAKTTQQLEHMVEQVGFFDLPVAVSGGGVGADFYKYEITLRQGDRQHVVVVTDDNTPETKPLVEFVNTLTTFK
jgi:hypothetical protein